MHLSRVRNDHAADKWGNCLDYGVGIACCETKPGEQMQADWAVIRRGSNRLSVFVATLGWSRAAYVEFVTDGVRSHRFGPRTPANLLTLFMVNVGLTGCFHSGTQPQIADYCFAPRYREI